MAAPTVGRGLESVYEACPLPRLTSGFAALRAIGWPGDALPRAGAWAEVMAAHPRARPARVVEQHRSGYIVAEDVEGGYAVESLPEWQRPAGYRQDMAPAQQRPAVGDWLLVEAGADQTPKVAALLPRYSAIKRGAAGEHYKQQVIAANIDTVFVVCGLDGDFNPRRIERYLLLVHGGGAQPVVVLTKADRDGADPAAALAALADVAGPGVPVVAVNAKDRVSVAALHRWLPAGSTAVLVGSSGAGKSTLTNTLLGREKMKTRAVREADARGRHTTTHRALIALPTGACLIDTPGMRELKPTGEETLVDGGFVDIAALADACRFRDCRHDREPGCAVRSAIAAGTLDPARFANYLKLRDEVAGAAGQLATRLAEQAAVQGHGPASGRRGEGKPGKR
ncbi:MAG: ribosome small subunit-dependent GTPase A [Pseudomonadota bacterium]|nr:ribosome small subunit-dependent GTPase A [Pseudomonadota bacterium]